MLVKSRFLQRSNLESREVPNPLFFLAIALAHSGRFDEAQSAMARMLELRPKTTVSWYRRRGLYRVADDLEFVLEGARMAGLPE